MADRSCALGAEGMRIKIRKVKDWAVTPEEYDKQIAQLEKFQIAILSAHERLFGNCRDITLEDQKLIDKVLFRGPKAKHGKTRPKGEFKMKKVAKKKESKKKPVKKGGKKKK